MSGKKKTIIWWYPNSFDQKKFETASLEAIIASFQVIRPFLSGQKDIGEIETKADDTFVTVIDRLSEDAGFTVMRRYFPNIPIIREESGLSKGSNTDCELWNDPLDGTAPTTIGAQTSTVIWAFYDKLHRTLVSVAIGEPAYGRIWRATLGKGCELIILNPDYTVNKIVPKKVWGGEMSPNTAVFVDLGRGFTRSKGYRQILKDVSVTKLISLLNPKVRLQLYGSNGMHHVLVANGNKNVVGGFTTAMGGPWDAAGALLITEAGGVCCAWEVDIEANEEIISLVEVGEYEKIESVKTMSRSNRTPTIIDPLDPLTYDILIYANNKKNLNKLKTIFKKALKADKSLYRCKKKRLELTKCFLFSINYNICLTSSG